MRAAHPDSGELQQLHDRRRRDPEGFWAAQARAGLHWHKPFTQVLDASQAPNFRWFADGQLNVSHSCLDAQLPTRSNSLALVFEAESGAVRKLTYGELHAEVCRFANALRALGAQAGDRIVIYMPLVPEAIVATSCPRVHRCHPLGGVRWLLGALAARSHRGRWRPLRQSPPMAAGVAARWWSWRRHRQGSGAIRN